MAPDACLAGILLAIDDDHIGGRGGRPNVFFGKLFPRVRRRSCRRSRPKGAVGVLRQEKV